MELRLRNVPPKRVFGRDLTNLDQRRPLPERPKNSSIAERPKNPSLDKPASARSKSQVPERRGTTLREAREAVSEYEEEIMALLLAQQRKQEGELGGQVTSEMRAILVDWLVEVHGSFELKEQTLFLALAYLNAYAARRPIAKHAYQLVGVAALWIASKYEEIYPPRMRNYVDVTDSSYSLAELKDMEASILLALDFSLNTTTPLQILDALAHRWPKEDGHLTRDAARTHCMCKYLLELALFEGLGKKYCMKTLVVTALMLADSVLKTKSDTRALDTEPLDKDTLMACFKDLCTAMQNACRPHARHKAIRKKYSHQRYMEVAKFRIEPR